MQQNSFKSYLKHSHSTPVVPGKCVIVKSCFSDLEEVGKVSSESVGGVTEQLLVSDTVLDSIVRSTRTGEEWDQRERIKAEEKIVYNSLGKFCREDVIEEQLYSWFITVHFRLT